MAVDLYVSFPVFRIGIRHCTISLMDGQEPTKNPGEQPAQFAPGDTIRPQRQAPPTVGAEAAPPSQQPAAPAPIEPQAQPQQASPTQTASVPMGPATPPESNDVPYSIPTADSDDVVRWTASEYIAHNKSSGWYMVLLAGAVVIAVAVWWFTKDIISPIVVVFAGVMLATFAARKPQQLEYQLDPGGLTIAQRYYSFNDFRSFSVMPDGAFSSIVFTPLKRFGAWTTIYYDPKDEEKIVSVISQRIPHEERKPDVVDSMMRRIRF